jgi:RND family efflux transporter MFP subunit
VDRLRRLETAKPERTSLCVYSEMTATVEAMEKADLCAQVRGVVKSIPAEVDIGRYVKEGETLITLDIPDLLAEYDNKQALLTQAHHLKEQAFQTQNVAAEEVKETQAKVMTYQADLKYHEENYERVAKLVQDRTVQPQLGEEAKQKRATAEAALRAAQVQVETKKARLKAAEADLKVADSRIKVAEAEVERLRALVGFAAIKAPFDGIITKRWVDRGVTVKDLSMPLLTVMRTDTVRVLFDVPERDVPFIRTTLLSSPGARGNRVTLKIPALQSILPGGEVKGTEEEPLRVSLMASALDPMTRTMRTEVHVDNKSRHLRPGMTGTVTVLLGQRDGALTIPSTALVRQGQKIQVYYVADPTGDPPRGVVKRVDVELGLDDGRRVEIRSGLTGNELVIIKGNGVVHVGDTARAVQAHKVEE